MVKPFNFEELVDKYRRVRDKKAELKKKHEAELAPYNEALALAEADMMRHLDAIGVESAKTKAGTVYVSTSWSASVADWDATLNHIRENEAWHLLNRAVSKTAVRADAEAGVVVPGVDLTSYRTVGVRKPEKKD